MKPFSAGSWLTLLVLMPALAFAGVTVIKGVEHKDWPDKYDPYYKKYTKRYFGPAFDWRWFKAQGIAESNLKPNASSAAGALGIMQILPSTFDDLRKKNPHFTNIKTPQWNIAAAIYYDRMLYKRWKKTHPGDDRIAFTFASYNAGHGRMQRIIKKIKAEGESANKWSAVEPHAPGETRHYVRKIKGLMKGGG
jgi:membrane-bound lytic murein transglycosylase F